MPTMVLVYRIEMGGLLATVIPTFESLPTITMVGYSRTLQTHTDGGDESPEWNQWLDFGVNTWRSFTVQVFDDDVGSDDTLSDVSTESFTQHISRTYVRKNCHSGYIYFDYFFTT